MSESAPKPTNDDVPKFATTADLVNYVQSLELKSNKANDDDGRLGAIAGCASYKYDEYITSQVKEDIQNSTLFAQLVANDAVKPSTDWQKWYTTWRSTLKLLGWDIPDFEWADVPSSSYGNSILEAILDYSQGDLSNDEQVDLVTLTKLLNATRNGPAKGILNGHAVDARSSLFQLGLVSKSGRNARMTCCCYKITMKDNITDVLNQPIKKTKSVVQFKAFSAMMTLKDSKYSDVREQVKTALSKHAAEIAALF